MRTFQRHTRKAAKMERRDEARAFNRRELFVAVGFMLAGLTSAIAGIVALAAK